MGGQSGTPVPTESSVIARECVAEKSARVGAFAGSRAEIIHCVVPDAPASFSSKCVCVLRFA